MFFILALKKIFKLYNLFLFFLQNQNTSKLK